MKKGVYPNLCTDKISKENSKSPGDLKILQDTKKKPSELVWKTRKKKKIKGKILKEYLRQTRKLLQTKLCSRDLIKEINTWAIPLQDTQDHSWNEQRKKWTRGQQN